MFGVKQSGIICRAMRVILMDIFYRLLITQCSEAATRERSIKKSVATWPDLKLY